MSKVEKEVKTFVVHLYCDKLGCGEEMFPTGKVITTNPLSYEYKCPNCDNVVIEDKVYPLMIHREI